MSRRFLAAGALLWAGLAGGWGVPAGQAAEPDAAKRAFFETKIRPVLVERCLECHGAESEPPDGNLRLDLKAGWQTGGDSGPALTPGDAAGSVLMGALRYETYEMPPDEKLPAHVIADFERWIADGAVDPRGGTLDQPDETPAVRPEADGWTYTPPHAEPAPAVENAAWPRTVADRFVLAKVEAAGLEPAPDAAPAAAFRRLHFDLSGLPPEPDDLAAFLAEPSDANWRAAVDRLLASPRFGQTWGRHWLDVARYADSNGSDFNATWPDAWRYRDYVVDAFNRDLPFDRFLTEQIAGDLLPADSDEQRTRQTVATGFLALGTKMLSERDKQKLTFDVADDQIDTVGRAAMGLTLGCARCHDHKFDPIPTREYYALAGIFASTKTLDGEMQKYVSDFVRVPLPEDPAAVAARAEWGLSRDLLKNEVAHAKNKLDEARFGWLDAMVVDDSEAKAVGDWKDSMYAKSFVGSGYLTDGNTGKGEKSLTYTAKLPHAGRWEARLLYSASGNRASNVPVEFAGRSVTVNQRKKGPLFDRAASLGTVDVVAGEEVKVIVRTTGTNGYVIGDAVAFVPVDALNAKIRPDVAAAEKEHERLAEALEAMEANAPPAAPTAFGVTDRASEEVSDTAIRVRGEAGNEGEVVPRGVLSVCGGESIEIAAGSGRLELARWITRPDHPLTARVFVNRVWGHLFGRGIVRTVDNFGALGAPPTHPELLDRLAADFVADGWRVKPLVRELVLSRTYRLGSAHPGASTADPENDLFARANRRRLTAEALRDTTLHLAGRLDEAPPGRSPVAGFGRLAVDTQTGKPTGPVDVQSLTVRSVFLPLIRNELPDALTAFDFADPEAVVGVRPETSGPAQSLFLLNAPQVRDRAEAAGERFRGLAGSRGEKVAALYRAALSREPTAAELDRATRFLNDAAARDGEAGAWTDLAHVLFCSAAFRFLD